jgi:hypothetical protein
MNSRDANHGLFRCRRDADHAQLPSANPADVRHVPPSVSVSHVAHDSRSPRDEDVVVWFARCSPLQAAWRMAARQRWGR